MPGIIPILANCTVKIGRHAGSKSGWIPRSLGPVRQTDRPCASDYIVNDPAVSRSHIEIYAIIFDVRSSHQPLIYIRDHGSSNGTFVNGKRIGGSPGRSPARLLDSGDVFRIAPSMSFCLRQDSAVEPRFQLTSRHKEETAASLSSAVPRRASALTCF